MPIYTSRKGTLHERLRKAANLFQHASNLGRCEQVRNYAHAVRCGPAHGSHPSGIKDTVCGTHRPLSAAVTCSVHYVQASGMQANSATVGSLNYLPTTLPPFRGSSASLSLWSVLGVGRRIARELEDMRSLGYCSGVINIPGCRRVVNHSGGRHSHNLSSINGL